MSFGQNLQFLRKMHERMTQDELAEKINVSRQTISKWEMDSAFPEMEKAITLCKLFLVL
ncbi:helix-turn-helix transcriptional regulator [Clostridium perfringens]|uniref:helix-turn-helix transcriptional regulator n=1 Tax=Clostridium perfringens TaxID=1502 RepID=UPI002ACD2692|nr:helix-turn-helix transcriptional regulator [Clostridium perfringens]